MNNALLSSLRHNAQRQMAALRSRYREVTPIPLPDKDGCRNCGSVDESKGRFHLSILSRGIDNKKALVTVAVFCPTCYDSSEAQEKVLAQAVEVHGKIGL